MYFQLLQFLIATVRLIRHFRRDGWSFVKSSIGHLGVGEIEVFQLRQPLELNQRGIDYLPILSST